MPRYRVFRVDKQESVDPTLEPTSNNGTPNGLWSGFANQIRDILGSVNWYDAPAATLNVLAQHLSRVDNPHATTHAQTNPPGANPAAPAPQDATRNKHLSDADAAAWEGHGGRTDNPHATTAAQVGAIAKAGDTGVTPFTLTRDPQAALEPATMQYVDAARAGLDLKQSVRASTTANVALATGGLLTVDGVALVAGDRVLVKNQTAGAENGIYLAAAGAWTRAPDADSGPEVTPNAFVFVEEGATQADTGWAVSTNGPITLGTTAIAWTQFSGPGAVTAGAGLTRTGNQISAQFGTATGTVTEGNDGRLSNARTPTAHSGSHASGGTDPISPAQIGAAPNEHAHRFAWDPVRAASTANVDLVTGGLLTVDGVVLVAGDRVLVKNQTTASQNGVYVAASGAWTRAADADASGEFVPGKLATVAEGTAQADTAWILATDGAITPGTTALAFNQLSGGGGSVVDASSTQKGVTKLSVAPTVATDPIAVGTNDPRMPSSARSFFAAKDVAQGLVPGTATKLAFGPAEVNTGAGYDDANDRFVADRAGQVWVYCVLTGTGGVDAANIVMELFRNGVRDRIIGGAHTGSGRTLVASGGRNILVAANDFLEVYATYFAPTGAANLNVVATETHFSGFYVRG